MAFRRLRGVLAPLALFAGLFFFGLSLLILGTGSLESDERVLDASSLTVANGTAVMLYPTGWYGYLRSQVNVTYSFPQAPGDAFLVDCEEAEAVAAGRAPSSPRLAFMGLREWSFVVSYATTNGDETIYTRTLADGEVTYCAPILAFRWSAPEGDPAPNRPTVQAVHDTSRLDAGNLPPLLALMVGSAILALAGGLRWARARGERIERPPSGDSTVEALRGVLDRMGEQLERTRRHLLFAGVLGIFLWYPFLVPWAWRQANAVSDEAALAWAVAGATLAFLIVLTVLWAREFLRLDRELDAWRGRIGELRDREEHLLDTLEMEGR